MTNGLNSGSRVIRGERDKERDRERVRNIYTHTERLSHSLAQTGAISVLHICHTVSGFNSVCFCVSKVTDLIMPQPPPSPQPTEPLCPMET